jgi:nitronate monooxygenase
MVQMRVRGREILPVVQGGMGVGVSAHRLAGSVAGEGGMGTLSSVDLRRHHPDLMAATGRSRDKAVIDGANLEALDREIRAARELSGGRGLIAVNVMRAVSEYPAYVRQACLSGADAIVVGAGLPFDLPEITADFPDVALIPILSETRGVSLVLKKWMRKGRLPDAIVIEHPRYAGGHLGASRIEDLADARFDFAQVIPGILALFDELKIEHDRIPLIAAGGINSPQRLREVLALGAAGAQIGTPFAVTEECDAHPEFKRVLAEARPEDIVTFMSVAGLPARAVRTPWLDTYLERLDALQTRAGAVQRGEKPARECTLAFDCLLQCGLRDGLPRAGQFCIDFRLAAALRGDVKHGLFFRGSESVPFGTQIRPVRELIAHMLGTGTAGNVKSAASSAMPNGGPSTT